MKIELNEQTNIRHFGLVHPAVCFIPVREHQDMVKRDRDVWMKLIQPSGSAAPSRLSVNLYTGSMHEFADDQLVETLPDAKVVIG